MVHRPGFCYSWTKLLKFLQDSQKKRELNSLKTGYGENCLVHKPSESCFEAQIAFSFPEERMMAWPPNIYLLNQGWNKIPSKRQELNFLSRVKWTMLGTRKTSFLPKLIMNAVHWYPFSNFTRFFCHSNMLNENRKSKFIIREVVNLHLESFCYF